MQSMNTRGQNQVGLPTKREKRTGVSWEEVYRTLKRKSVMWSQNCLLSKARLRSLGTENFSQAHVLFKIKIILLKCKENYFCL